jgi:hypothetical protein
MKISRILCAAGCSLVLGLAATPPATTTLAATDSGWFDNEGRTDAYPSNPRFGNYAVGWDPVDFSDAVVLRDFFIFDLSSISGTITSATLDLYMPASPPDSGNGYLSYKPSEAYQVTSTSTSVNDLSMIYLQGSPAGQTIFGTLGTGTVFASTTVSAADEGTTIHITLNAAALAARGKSRGEAIKQVEVEVFRHRMDHGDGNTEGSRATRAVMVIGDRDPCECRTSILRAAERTPGRQRV